MHNYSEQFVGLLRRISHSYISARLSSSDQCSSGCACSPLTTHPVCTEDMVLYPNPCQAGCTRELQNEVRTWFIYYNQTLMRSVYRIIAAELSRSWNHYTEKLFMDLYAFSSIAIFGTIWEVIKDKIRLFLFT